jgi:hypothetical protein
MKTTQHSTDGKAEQAISQVPLECVIILRLTNNHLLTLLLNLNTFGLCMYTP